VAEAPIASARRAEHHDGRRRRRVVAQREMGAQRRSGAQRGRKLIERISDRAVQPQRRTPVAVVDDLDLAQVDVRQHGVDLAVEQDCGGSVSGSQRRLALRLAEERVTLDARGGSLA